MQKITPFLWFDDQAEEAVNFYTAVFKNAKIHRIFRYNEEAAEKTCRPVGGEIETRDASDVANEEDGHQNAERRL